ncbi:hypothetical protein EAT45_07735 [Campylobacter coli]|nr:hypothetical protein [Campylobacter coli]EAH6958317.1 hypothetical protein [Campylobacter coli]EAH7761745.1 hypothetical protein [Campylobacter coli]
MICEKGVRGLSECVARKTDKAHRPRKKITQLFLFFLSRAHAYANFFIFYIFLYIFRGLSKPYMMGASEILKVEIGSIKSRNWEY